MKKWIITNKTMLIATLVFIISLCLMLGFQNNPVVFGLASNIVAGYIFYIVIDFIPRMTKEAKADKILRPLFSNLKYLLATLLGVAKGLISVGENDKISFSFTKDYIVVNNVIWSEKVSDMILNYSGFVQDNLKTIIENPLFRDLADAKAEMILILHTSEFLSVVLKSVALSTEQDQKIISYHNFGKSLNDNVERYEKLFHEQLSCARKANENEKKIYDERIITNRQMYKGGKKGGSYVNGIGVREL